MLTYHVFKDNDESQSSREYVPILRTQAVRITCVIGTVSVPTVLTDRRTRFVHVAHHVCAIMRRIEIRQ